ncbi:MAG: hypothetical protein Q4E91_11640 [Lachnospiraceae bacterium]|nr:hypothetical protein [Lachnospiraceae bacterium]
MKRCMYCGHENEDSSQNCSKCGNRLLDIPPQRVMPAEDLPEEEEEQEQEPAATKLMPDLRSLSQENDSSEDSCGFLEGEEEEAPEEGDQEEPEEQPEEDIPDGEASYEELSFGEASPEEAVDQEPFYGSQADGYEGRDPFYMGSEQDSYSARNLDPAFGGMEAPYGGPASYGQGNGYPYGGQGFGYGAGGPEVQQQYGGQAYGYSQEVQQYGYPDRRQAQQQGYDYGRTQGTAGGSRQFMIKARKAVRSPLLFLALLFYTVTTAASIVNIITGNMINSLNSFQDTAQMVLGSNVAITFMNSMIDMAEGMNAPVLLLVNLVFCIPGLLMGIGLWIMFFQTSASKQQISTSGYTLVKVMVILKFIGLCVLLTAGLIISVAFVVAAGASSSVPSIIVGVVLLLIMIIVSVLVIMFYVQLLHCIKVMKWNAKAGADAGRISSFVPVMGILLTAGTVLTMLPMAPNDYLGLVSRGTSAAWLLFASIWVLVYRAKVKK